MPTYIRLIRMTDEGRRSLRKGAALYEEFQKIIEGNGGKLVTSWATLGRYDFVAVVEAPDNGAMLKISGLLGATGYITAETLPAVPTQEMVAALG